MVQFDKKGLESFIKWGEKYKPPVFVGREDIIKDILTIGHEAWTVPDHDLPGTTRIIQGAPGAGKSTVLAELAARAPVTDGARTQVLCLNSATINHPIDILAPLAERVNAEAAPDFLARDQTTSSVSGQLGAFGSSVGTERTATTTPHAPEPTLTAFRDWVRGLETQKFGLTKKGMTGPIIVAIDEAQRLQYPPIHPVAKVLQGIHDNTTSLPLTLVLAGLGDTDTRATEMGLTRGKAIHAIGALAADEVTALTTRWCAHFGITLAGAKDHLDALAAPCEGWPRHLHFALQAVGQAVLATDDAGHAGPALLAAVDWERVATAAAVSRLHYYRSQQRGPLQECPALVGAVLDDLRPKQHRTDLIDLIERHAETQPGRAWQVPEGMTARSLADHLLHRGALQEEADGSLTCPIPSFRSHLVCDWVRMANRTIDSAPARPRADTPEAARLIAATRPHTEEEIARWTALAAAWRRSCVALAALGAATLTKGQGAAHTILATLDDPKPALPRGGAVPPLPRALPHAERSVAALAAMIDGVRKAAQAVLDGQDDPSCVDTLGDVRICIDAALAATPEDQLAWAIEHLIGETPDLETPEASGLGPKP